MSDINHEDISQQQQSQTPLYTRESVANILKEFERQREEQREISYKGKQLPDTIREILDETPASGLKDDIKRFKKHVPKYNHDE
ncbi:hypothetical protein RMATCC62417_12653 [Rhizopus microsporus]|nr:hypothetical protein RMATCC62417_12653 [Rhizopus microsporus]